MKVTRARAKWDYLELTLDDGTTVPIAPEWKIVPRLNKLVFVGAEAAPDSQTAKRLDGGTVDLGPGFTDNPVVFALMCDFWHGVPGYAEMPVPKPDDPYVTAARPWQPNPDMFVQREIGLRRRYGRRTFTSPEQVDAWRAQHPEEMQRPQGW